MDGIAKRSWRDRQALRETRHEHTREVHHETLSPEAMAIIAALTAQLEATAIRVAALEQDAEATKAMVAVLRDSLSEHSVSIIRALREAMDQGAKVIERRDVA